MEENPETTPPPPAGGISQVLQHNIHALMRRRIRDERARPADERFMDRMAEFLGSVRAIWFHAVLFGGWLLIHLPDRTWLDPGLNQLGAFASVEAIFLWTLVLVRQNHAADEERRRNDLDLQISLLAEHEITRVLETVTKIAEKLGVGSGKDEELEELMRDIGPEMVMDHMDQAAVSSRSGEGSPSKSANEP